MWRHTRYLLAVVLVFVAACSKDQPPITVGEGAVTVVNTSSSDWSEVLITVNDHFRGYVPVLKAEGRANAPLSQFTTGHGQRWTQGTRVEKVVVKARNPDGSPIELTWDGQRPRR